MGSATGMSESLARTTALASGAGDSNCSRPAIASASLRIAFLTVWLVSDACAWLPVPSLPLGDRRREIVRCGKMRKLQDGRLDPVDRQDQVVTPRVALVVQELAQLIATGFAPEEPRRQNRYQKSARRKCLIQPVGPMLAERDAVDVLEDLEAVVVVTRDDADLQLQGSPQRRDAAMMALVVQSRVAEEGLRRGGHRQWRLICLDRSQPPWRLHRPPHNVERRRSSAAGGPP